MTDAAGIIQRAEERLCECGAAGSGEGHTDWCPAKKFDQVPKNMSAEDAQERLGLRASSEGGGR